MTDQNYAWSVGVTDRAYSVMFSDLAVLGAYTRNVGKPEDETKVHVV